MKRTTLLITLGLSLLAVALVGLIMTTRVVASPAAPTFTVTTGSDAAADLGDTNYSVCRTATFNTTCTLRAAIMKANRYPGGGVTIIVPSGAYTITLPPSGENDETTGDLNITQTVTIVGAGAANSIVDGGSVDRVFRIESGATVMLTAITIRHGLEQYGFPISSPLFEGGGIYNEGLLTLNSTVITENVGYASGGGISNFGTLTVTNSLIAGNALTAGGSNAGGLFNGGTATLNNTSVTANYALFDGGIANGGTMVLNNVTVSANTSFGGGAIDNQGGWLTLNNSTISGNNSAGGIYNASTLVLNNVTISANTNTYYGGGGITNVSPGTLTLNNSTISANSTTGSGGAIANSGTTRLFHVTIAGNLADSDAVGGNRTGGGISNTLGTVELWNTLVVENFHGSIADDCAGDPLTSWDYNYIQTTAGCSIGGPATTHNVYGGDALLGPLQNNGGATETRALWVGSPALDQIPSAQCRDSYATAPQPDQRGVARPINGLCDIGAFEGAQPTPLFNRNLIRNGNAENSAGSLTGAYVGTANWTNALGQFTAVPYNAPGGYPVLTDTIPLDHGYNFFSGGNVASSFGTQMVTVTAISTTIDTGLVNYVLSGDFGGYATQEDYARLTVFFIDGIGGLIGSNQIGDVTAAQRGNATGLLHRSANGIVPIGTRTISIRAAMYRVSAGVSNDGYADNLSLVLKPLSVYLPLVLR
jgi:hypothetical protein